VALERLDVRRICKPLPERRSSARRGQGARQTLTPTSKSRSTSTRCPTARAQQLEVRVAASVVEIFTGTKRVTAHPRSLVRNGYSTKPESHAARAPAAHAEWTPERMLTWAHKFGPYTTHAGRTLAGAAEHPEHAYKCLPGHPAPGQRVRPERLETARCAPSPSRRTRIATWPMS